MNEEEEADGGGGAATAGVVPSHEAVWAWFSCWRSYSSQALSVRVHA